MTRFGSLPDPLETNPYDLDDLDDLDEWYEDVDDEAEDHE